MSINMNAKSEPSINQKCFEHGKRLREARIAAGKTLCDVSGKEDGDLTWASQIERGIIENLSITPEEWVAGNKRKRVAKRTIESLQRLSAMLESGVPVEALEVSVEQTPDGPLTTRRNIVLGDENKRG